MSSLSPAVVKMIEPWLTAQDAACAGQTNRAWRLGTTQRFADATAQDCCEAAGRGDGRALRRMLANKPGPDLRGAFGMTPLMHAAAHGHRGLARRLEAQGACPTLEDQAGQTAIEWRILHEQTSRLNAASPSSAPAKTWETQIYLLRKAASAIKSGHETLLDTILQHLRRWEQRRAHIDGDAPDAPIAHVLLAYYYDLVHLSLRTAAPGSGVLRQISDFMGLPYLSHIRWREIVLRLLREPDCTTAMLRAARDVGADLNAIVGDMSLVDVALTRQLPLQTLRCVLDAGVAFEDDAYRRQKTFGCLLTAPSSGYFVRSMVMLMQHGFRLDRILYEEGNRDTCESILGHLTAESMNALAAAGLAFNGVARGGRTVAHFAAGCGWWADVARLLPALHAHGVDFNAADEQGRRPITYLMRQQRLIGAEILAAGQASGIDFELPTMTSLMATPEAPQQFFRVRCRDALSLAAVYNQIDAVGWLFQNKLCDSSQSVIVAAALARQFGHVSLAIRLLGCL